MTSKQRSNLKSIAATLKPIAQVGKEGVSDNLLKGLSDALEAHELIKCSVLDSSSLDVREAAEALAERCHAEVVQVIGRKFALYRETSREGVQKIELVQ